MDGFAYWILAMGDRVGIKKSQKCELSAVFCCKCQKNVVILQPKVAWKSVNVA